MADKRNGSVEPDLSLLFKMKKEALWQAPIITRAIIRTFDLLPNVSEIIEIGCDLGGNTAELIKQGFRCWGIEGRDQPSPFYVTNQILPFDFRKDLQEQLKDITESLGISIFSLAFSLGVTEHIEKVYVKDYLYNLCFASETVLMTIPPYQNVYGQVNWEGKDWWTAQMKKQRYGRQFSLETQFNDYLQCQSNGPEIKNLGERIMIFKAIRFTGRHLRNEIKEN